MKVLLPIDESQFSEQAVREVEERFGTPGTTVRILHVVAKFVPPAAALWDAGGSLEAVREEVVSRYQRLVEGVAERLTAGGVTAETAIKDGDPGKVIVNQAKEWGADLIVLGSHGHSRVVRMLLGSVAKYVVDQAPCSVEIVHRKEQKVKSEGNGCLSLPATLRVARWLKACCATTLEIVLKSRVPESNLVKLDPKQLRPCARLASTSRNIVPSLSMNSRDKSSTMLLLFATMRTSVARSFPVVLSGFTGVLTIQSPQKVTRIGNLLSFAASATRYDIACASLLLPLRNNGINLPNATYWALFYHARFGSR